MEFLLMRIFWTSMLVLMMGLPVLGQNSDTTHTNGIKPKIFIDGYNSDFDQVRNEVRFVDYVRDRRQADIYLMVTRLRTGTGREYTLTFSGQKSFTTMNDTLNYYTSDFDSDDIRRDAFINTLKRGLVRYINKTELADKIEITYKGNGDNGKVWDDPWDNWVFRLSLSGNMQGEKYQQSYHIHSSARISRITEEWKIRFELNGSYYEDRYQFDDENLTSSSSSKSISTSVAKSISNHLSLGLYGFAGASTYSNIRLHVGLQPGIEFNIFPYNESTYHEFRFVYTIGYNHYNYIDMTIYNKFKEAILKQQLEAVLEIKQPWGEIDLTLKYSNQVYNFSRDRIEVYGKLFINIFEGFSFDIGGGYSGINDQINLALRDLTIDEVLLKRRQLETQYYYWGSAGFSYTFGSIYNNIVNPRFGN
jgi:hypothetical protein